VIVRGPGKGTDLFFYGGGANALQGYNLMLELLSLIS